MKKGNEAKEETFIYYSDVCLTCLSSQSTAKQRVYIPNTKTFSTFLKRKNPTGDSAGTIGF